MTQDMKGVSAVTDLAMQLASTAHLTRGPHETRQGFLERMRLAKFGRAPKKVDPDEQVAARLFISPGQVAPGRPRPTAVNADSPLNTVNFTREKALLFSDGSFRIPGRRRLKMTTDGRTGVLSGRQLRKLRKGWRKAAKAQQVVPQEDVPTT